MWALAEKLISFQIITFSPIKKKWYFKKNQVDTVPYEEEK